MRILSSISVQDSWPTITIFLRTKISSQSLPLDSGYLCTIIFANISLKRMCIMKVWSFLNVSMFFKIRRFFFFSYESMSLRSEQSSSGCLSRRWTFSLRLQFFVYFRGRKKWSDIDKLIILLSSCSHRPELDNLHTLPFLLYAYVTL